MKTWDDVEEDDPTQDEIETFTEYKFALQGNFGSNPG